MTEAMNLSNPTNPKFDHHGQIVYGQTNIAGDVHFADKPDPNVLVPIVLVTMTKTIAEDLARKEVFEKHSADIRRDFEELESKLRAKQIDWLSKYDEDILKWHPFDNELNVAVIIEDAFKQMSGLLQPVFWSLEDVANAGTEQTLQKRRFLRDEGGLVIVDTMAIRHPSIQKQFRLSALEFYPKVSVVCVTPHYEVKDISYQLIDFSERYEDSELYRRLNVFLDDECENACDLTLLRRWLSRQATKYAPQGIRKHMLNFA